MKPPRVIVDHSLYEVWCMQHPEKRRRSFSEWLADLIAWIVVG